MAAIITSFRENGIFLQMVRHGKTEPFTSWQSVEATELTSDLRIALFSLVHLVEKLLEERLVILEDSGVLLTFKYVSMCTFDEGPQLLSRSDLVALSIRPYDQVRISASAHRNPSFEDFRIDLDIQTLDRKPIRLKEKVGDLFEDGEGRDFYLMPGLAGAIRFFGIQEVERKTDQYRADARLRHQRYSEARKHLIICQAAIDTWISKQQTEFVDEIDYRITIDENGNLDAEPSLSADLAHLNNSLNDASTNKAQGGVGASLNSKNGRVNLYFEGQAKTTWEKIREVKKKSQNEKNEILRNPESYFDGKSPTEIIGSMFSDRVSGFVVGPI
ncbi:MAG: hypothetical protein ABL958_19815, partial [Bdellovibrionia bacterium]